MICEPAITLAPVEPSVKFEDKANHVRIAVQIHLYYVDQIDEMIAYSNNIPYYYEYFISTDMTVKAVVIRACFRKASHTGHVEVAEYPNRGRDISPFVLQMTSNICEYDYLCHLHTKHSAHDRFGAKWRKLLLESLLASPGHVAALLALMETDSRMGLVFPKTYWRVKPYLDWRGNRAKSEALMKRMDLTASLPDMPQFPVGDMFWARTQAILPAFKCGLTMDDFPPEEQQLDGTTAHCLERCWGCIAQAKGFGYARVKAYK